MQSGEAACLGAAIIAGVGIGMFKSLEEATSKMVKIKERFQPNPENAGLYARYFKKYVDLYDALVGMFAKE